MSNKTQIVLFDGREVTDDTIGLSQLLTGLNQLLRKRKDVIFCWPTNDMNWHNDIFSMARKIGGSNFVPDNSDISVKGPIKEDWMKVLERVLIQLDLSFDDLSLSQDVIRELVDNNNTIGEFLGTVGQIISERVTDTQIVNELPKLVFVVSSGELVESEANRIRRAGTLILKAEELLSYSPRSESGKWWKSKLKDQNHHLAYIISLFDARLTTIMPSAVNYACLHHGDDYLKKIVADEGIKPHKVNARSALTASDLYKFLNNETTKELTSAKKGKLKDVTLNAYKKIQSKSAKHHKDINMAICALLSENMDTFDSGSERFEVDAGDGNLFTDAIIKVAGNTIYLEFHHLSRANCKASKMSAYIMGKLRAYANHYNLVPR